jgi:curved DNA-binding protein
MTGQHPLIDYYSIFKVRPTCSAKVLEAAYHRLAKMYHPDSAETADTAKFTAVLEAFRALRDPAKRAEYDRLYGLQTGQAGTRDVFGEMDIDEATALSDADAQVRILLYLYKKRREQAQDAGIAGFYLQQALECSAEHFEFHVWYLKAKGFVDSTEQGTLAITIDGIDHVLSLSRASRTEKLLLGHAAEPDE